MKRGLSLLTLFVFAISLVSADTCDLSVTMVNQDPYPANPGEYVKLVFQVDGIQDNNCGDLSFNLVSDYPISLDPSEPSIKNFKRVDYLTDFESSILIPYKVRVDMAALDGSNEIKVIVQNENDAPITTKFNLEVDNTESDFEINIKDFDYSTNELTLEILNIGETDVKALVIEIPKQDQISVKGSNRVIVGDLDSSDYTTSDFEALPNNGEFNVFIIYSDAQSLRRTVEKSVSFDSSYFTNRKADEPSDSKAPIYIWSVVILLVIWFIWRKILKSRKKKNKLAK